MVLHALLSALVVDVLAFAYQASSEGDGLADIASGFSRSRSGSHEGHEDD